MKIFKLSITLLITTFFSFALSAQKNFFNKVTENSLRNLSGKRTITPAKYQTFSLDVPAFFHFLLSLPKEQQPISSTRGLVMELPMPDGSFSKFKVWESPIMEPGLAARYPEIRTYAGQGIDDPYATVRMDYNPYFGFSAQVLSSKGDIYIDPYSHGDIRYYISYHPKDNHRNTDFSCLVEETEPATANRLLAGPCRGTTLFTYRLALACTGEYAAAVCSPSAPTVPATLAAMTTSVNRVTGVYEKEVDVRLILIFNTDQLIYLDGTSDPYSNNNGGAMLGQNQNNIDNIIGTNGYDIGHVFSTGGGGVAGLGVVCNPTQKARGVTGLPFPVGDDFDIDYVAHEMGHQFGGRHTFNSVDGLCSGNRSSSAAYEVGSGTTIMGYAGICDNDDIQPHSDPYFHAISFDEISTLVENSAVCYGTIATGNLPPIVTAMNNNGANIPLSTPFVLTGAATDPDGNPITYSWEEWDLGPSTTWNDGNSTTTAPLFKSRVPKTTGSRTFPDLANILAGYPANPPVVMGGMKGETLPTVARALKFRLTVRDNRAAGGGVSSGGNGCQAGFTAAFQVNAIAGTGPFVVAVPNGGEVWMGATNNTITWNVAGTSAAPISCANVKITMSTDGGLTYPNVITASTPNDGSESLVIPLIITSTARIRIEAVGNIFFDISDANFTIIAPPSTFTFDSPGPATLTCGVSTSAQIVLNTNSFGGFSTPINLSASGNPAPTTVSFAPNPVNPGSSTTVTLNNTGTLPFGTYTITVTGTAGAITQTRDLTFNVQPGVGPTITTHPVSQSACVGSTVTFTVASPGASSFQWQISTNGGGSFSNIGGATTTSLTLSGITAGMNANQYRALAFNQCNSTASNAAVLTVQSGPVITAHPQSLTQCAGSNVTFNVTANGSNLSYQWQVSTNGGGSFSNTGGNSSSLTVNNINVGMNSYQYRVIVNGVCPPPATSNAAVLTVINPVSITQQPSNSSICETGNTSFTVAGSGTGIIYQWEYSSNGGAGWTTLAGANSSTLNVPAVTASMNGYLYRALLSNATCTSPIISSPGMLTVSVRPAVTIAAAPYTNLLPGLSTTITATTVPPSGFNITWFLNGVLIPGATGNSIPVTVNGLGTYYANIVDPVTGCNNRSANLIIKDSISGKLFIYPSPNQGLFTISFYNAGGITSKQSVRIFDMIGKLVYQAEFPISSTYPLLSIDMRTAQRGIYYVLVGNGVGLKLAGGKVLIH